MKRILFKLCYATLALFFIVSLFAIISESIIRYDSASISFTPAESRNESVVVLDDEIPDVFVGPNEEYQDSLQCDYEDHVFDSPQFVTDNKHPLNYMRIEICKICGYEAQSYWTVYIPDDATEIPAPGGERDILLGVGEGFSCE